MPNAPFYKTPEWRRLRKERLELDGYRCTVPGCGQPANIVEHTETRPNVPHLCEVDRIEKLRSRCRLHDNQVKEDQAGNRRSGGKLTVTGVDADGVPLDPNHPWAKSR